MTTTIFFVILTVAGTMLLVLLLVLWHKRRRTPVLTIDRAAFPPADRLLPTLAGITNSAIYEGNRAWIIQNGAFFPRLLEDVDGASRSIHLETFVWARGRLERQLVDALCVKAGQGVAVRVLIDAVGGAKASEEQLARLREAGATVRLYCKLRPWNWARFNHRTHRKLLIVDGHVGYTFGHGVADQWLGDAEDSAHWRDTAVRCEGPVVAGLQGVFAENWTEETCEMLIGDACFPYLHTRGEISAHVVSSASGDALSAVSMLYAAAIAAAREQVLIQNPYFVPDRPFIDLLCETAARGVRVRMMLPGAHTDSPVLRRASRHLYPALVDAGIELYEYQRTLNHQKIMVVDGVWSHVGSTNFDARSLALNEEISVSLCDRAIAAELAGAFEADLRHCRRIGPEECRRSVGQRYVDALVYQLHEQL